MQVYCTVCITALARMSERIGYLCTSGPLLSGSVMFEPLLLFWGGVVISRVFGMIFIIKCLRDGGGMRMLCICVNSVVWSTGKFSDSVVALGDIAGEITIGFAAGV